MMFIFDKDLTKVIAAYDMDKEEYQAVEYLYKEMRGETTSPYDYYQKSKDHILINQETSDLLDRWLLLLKEHGEEAALPQIRQELKDPEY